jgi:hypothetical protein
MPYMKAPLQRYGMGDSMPDGTPCPAGTVYNTFYESCVTACPKGQAYDAQGICKAVPPQSTVAGIPTTYLMVGAVALLGIALFKKKRR